jgi:hypothetical protein
MQQRLPGFAEVESPISVDVIWLHLNFDGFSDETIHVAGFCRQEFSVKSRHLPTGFQLKIILVQYKRVIYDIIM